MLERASSQVFSNEPKIYRRWIKKWTKRPHAIALESAAPPRARAWKRRTQRTLFGRCFLCSCEKERKTDGVKSIPKSPQNVAPFTIGGWPVDALSPGTMRLLRKIADQDGWTIEEVMTAAMEEFVATRKAEKELETKIICFPKS